MDLGSSGQKTARFGLFEADVQQRVLTKNGLRVRLQDQPFQVLALLLERPGELVTREEIQQRLWPADTYVAFDDGLNTAIKKLRSALSDTADNPRFIETVPRRGYRFVAPVTFPAPAVAGPPAKPESAVAENILIAARCRNWRISLPGWTSSGARFASGQYFPISFRDQAPALGSRYGISQSLAGDRGSVDFYRSVGVAYHRACQWRRITHRAR